MRENLRLLQSIKILKLRSISRTEQFAFAPARLLLPPTGTSSWQNANTLTVALGSVVNLGPLPSSGGSWSWYSPNYVMSSTSRIQQGVPLNEIGYNYFWAKYTTSSGVPILQEFSIYVE